MYAIALPSSRRHAIFEIPDDLIQHGVLMIGRRIPSPVPALVCAVLTLAVAACNPDRATTGPSGVNGKDFAANLRMVSGDQQVGPLAQTLRSEKHTSELQSH